MEDKAPKDILWDVIVVGGGPAGMMAAGRAAELGAHVVLLEKNESLGKKLLITGGGRCNVTNAETDTRKLLEKFKDAGRFLFSAFSQWSVAETLDFFHSKGMPTKIEGGLRVFPVSDSAKSVWTVMFEYMRKNSVMILPNSGVVEIVKEEGKVVGVKLKNKRVIRGKSIIIATGGTSRPETGSTGDGYTWLKDIGHTVITPEASLVPIALKDKWVKRLAGVSLADVKIIVLQNSEKQGVSKGKILFTHVGISGPTILNMSKDVGELLKYGQVILSLDLLPKEDYGTLNTKLQELFKEHDKKNFKNALVNIVPSAIAPIVIELSGINPETKCNSVTREERVKLIHLLKAIPMHVDKLLGVEKAIVTSGGVILSEVDFKTMSSRLYPNLYLVGDILNVDRPSGGYSLQLCWTTGYVAGTSAVEHTS
ncbi:MAG: NAD(P)/FAD-dependent oxidoreductase [Patescibacteria group bacterium]